MSCGPGNRSRRSGDISFPLTGAAIVTKGSDRFFAANRTFQLDDPQDSEKQH
jgi:hypothetical protein